MQNKIFIRADGGQKVGLGHLIRCIALAHMLKDDFEIHFICLACPEDTIKEIITAGFFYTKIGSEEVFLNILLGGEIVVLDGYTFGEDYQKELKTKGCTLVCIDDLHDRNFYADLIINHGPEISSDQYKAQIYTQFALGPSYALLRPAFLKARQAARKTNEKSHSVMICFGGSDYKNLTQQTLDTVLTFNFFNEIIVITGSASQTFKEQEGFNSNYKVKYYHSVNQDEMSELMYISDLVIVPSSGILLEALALGCKIISGMYVDNQKYLFENYKKLGGFISAEDFSDSNLRNALNVFFQTGIDPPNLIDGKSSERILKLFNQLVLEKEIYIRKANEADNVSTFKWAKNKKVRAFSFNQNEITFEEHSKWFSSKIDHPRCYYYIAELNHKAIGSIRFDVNDGEALISYLIDPKFHGSGLGISLLKKGIIALLNENDKSILRIVGFVMGQNIASVKAFERLGFTKRICEENYKYSSIIN